MTEHAPLGDAERAAGLLRMKRMATGLFVLVTVLFLVARTFEDRGGWVEYVRAFAEAAMVGALADWFAVTALFRHPLGLPIPHTAIVPRRKDQIGRSLGEFVQSEFMTAEVIGERLRGFEVSRRTGAWLLEPANTERAAETVGEVIRAGLEVLDDDDVQRSLERLIERRVREVPVAPLVGRAVQLAVEGGHHERALDTILLSLRSFLDEHRTALRSKLSTQSPWWVPEPIDDRIFAKIFDGVHAFLGEIAADPTHEIRHSLEERVVAFSIKLREDPDLLARGEALKDEALEHPDVRAWMTTLWSDLRAAIETASRNPDSELRGRISETLRRAGERLTTDAALAAKIDRWIESATSHLVVRYRHEVAELIASTVERWDGESTSRKLELNVGRDLQFIRINGTIVGGLAGVTIHLIGSLVA